MKDKINIYQSSLLFCAGGKDDAHGEEVRDIKRLVLRPIMLRYTVVAQTTQCKWCGNGMTSARMATSGHASVNRSLHRFGDSA